ncbi:MAG: magnesium/cobalt transporter CorA [Verrucomicrobia bacterium]|nr:magnesium/cobalt transporter CorA [Verrucomicrobiota bacterium]
MKASYTRDIGLPPGHLNIPEDSPLPTIDVIAYSAAEVVQKRVADPDEIKPFLGKSSVVWVDVNGLGDEGLLTKLGDLFGFHRLSLEDVVSLNQRPKVEEYDDYLFIVMQYPVFENGLDFEQICIYLGKGYVVTFQSTSIHRLETILDRIVQDKGRVRKSSSGYLAYTMIDVIIDSYFPLLEKNDEDVEDIEAAIMQSTNSGSVKRIYRMKRCLVSIRRVMWGVRDMLNTLTRDQSRHFEKETLLYLRDAYDHSLRIIEMNEGLREMCSSLMDFYLSQVSNRMNEVMKVLTIMASVFIPLTFIAGIYGMNFSNEASRFNMPELTWKWGYPLIWVVMILVAGGMLWFFKRKGWLRSSSDVENE